MKNKLILCGSVLLTACSSGSYVTDVKTETYQEDYPVAQIQPMAASENQMTSSQADHTVGMDANTAQQKSHMSTGVKIAPPTAKQVKAAARFGFTIQIAAVGTDAKASQFASKLPQGEQPIWRNYKVVNGTKWYTVLYGDYATKTDAKSAINTLPMDIQKLKPFIKSIDAIKNSNYPGLKKLN
jgi:septal ring-binding cell division protein DamX